MSVKKIFELALILSANDKASKVIADSVSKSKKSIDSLNKAGDKAYDFGKKAGAAGIALLAPLGVAVNAAEESEIAFRRLDSTFRTMGETDSKAAKAAADYASNLQERIGIEDEEIEMVQSKIASFRKVSDETARMSGVFDRATEAAFDLAAGGFGEASSNAVQLGKALQNPAIGAQALAKAGALNKSDIPLIKQIQATKGLGAAQEYVLKAVEKQVKGQAANTATSASKMKIQFGEVAETVGKTLLPQVSKTMAEIGKAVKKFNEWAQANPKLLTSIVTIIGKLGLFSLAVSGIAFAFGGILKTIALVKQAMLLYQTVMAGVTIVQNVMAMSALAGSTALQTLGAVLKALNLGFLTSPIFWIVLAIAAAAFLIIKYWDPIKAFFAKLWDGIKIAFTKFWEFVKNWGVLLLGPIGLIIKYWDNIKGFFLKLWPSIKAIFWKALEWYLYLPKLFLKIGTDIVMGLWNGIKSKATALFDFVKGVGKSIAKAFKTVLGIASPSKVFMDYGVNITEGAKKGIEKGSPGAVNASSGMGKAISPNGGNSGGISGGGITVNFSPVISGGGDAQNISEELKKLVPQLIREIQSVMERKQKLSF